MKSNQMYLAALLKTAFEREFDGLNLLVASSLKEFNPTRKNSMGKLAELKQRASDCRVDIQHSLCIARCKLAGVKIREDDDWQLLIKSIFANLLSERIVNNPNLWASNFQLYLSHRRIEGDTVRFILTFLSAVVDFAPDLPSELRSRLSEQLNDCKGYFEARVILEKAGFRERELTTEMLREKFPSFVAYRSSTELDEAQSNKRRRIIKE